MYYNNMYTLHIGTLSKQKISYVEDISIVLLAGYSISPVEVSSNVSDQPISLEETESGAKNRAFNTWNASQPKVGDIAIGLEAGLSWNDSNAVLVCVACIYDGKSYFSSTTSGLLVPKKVSDRVREGAEFGVEIRNYLDEGPKDPYTFSVVKELVDREISFKIAIHNALIQWQLGNNLRA